MSYLSTLMALLIHLDLFSKHIVSQGNVHLVTRQTSNRCSLHLFSGDISVTKGGERSWPE